MPTLRPGETVELTAPIERGNLFELYFAPTKDSVYLDEAALADYTLELVFLSPNRVEIEHEGIVIESGAWVIGADTDTSVRITMTKAATESLAKGYHTIFVNLINDNIAEPNLPLGGYRVKVVDAGA